ncbi:hypothetical protein [Parabacteroides sp.]
MTQEDKINWLKENEPILWANTFKIAKGELSDKQTMFCCCGKLATGLHEDNCRKFLQQVKNETAKRLQEYIK